MPGVGINLQQGQVTGIASVLVFGAATDYALLLIARYREELRREEDRFAAMRAALRRTAEPILASGGTVVLGVLTLLLSRAGDQPGAGVACATGVVFAMLSALFVLPAALVLFGRGLFWPFVPRVGGPAREGRLWGRARRRRAAPPGGGRGAGHSAARRPGAGWHWASAPACPRPNSSAPSPRRWPGARPWPRPSPPAAPSRSP